MTEFSLTCNPRKDEDQAILNSMMMAWEGQQVADAVWLLKRNDGCTCQDVIEDLLEYIDAENDISVMEIRRKDSGTRMTEHS